MEFRNLGRSGLRVSTLGLGCNNFGGRLDRSASQEVIHAALNAGVTLFDTADVYPMNAGGGSEEIIGETLGDRRKDIVLATKFGMKMDEAGVKQGGSRRYIVQACEDSLRRLKTDWIDLFYSHKPDPLTPIDETIRALDDLVRAGKVRYLGCSNFAGWQIVEAQYVAKELGAERFICSQEEYSLLVRDADAEVIPAIENCGMGLLPFFPLASGLLTGKYRKGQPPPEGSRIAKVKVHEERFMTDGNMDRMERYRNFSESHGKQLIDLAFSWLLARKPVASVIAGASTAEQVADNAEAIGWTLTDKELSEVDAIHKGTAGGAF